MKKYDLSKIMKRAWEICRKAKCEFRKALAFSWVCAKEEVAMKEEWHEPNGIVTWNIWVGYGHVRAYYKRSFVSKYQNNKRDVFVEM